MSNIDGVDVEIEAMYAEVIRSLHDVGFSDDVRTIHIPRPASPNPCPSAKSCPQSQANRAHMQEREEVLSVLAAVIHIGNIQFQSVCPTVPSSFSSFSSHACSHAKKDL